MKALSYKDIYLVPRYSELTTRKNADTSIRFGSKTFKLPVMPSNMKAVIDVKWAKWLSENDYMYVMHRFDNITYSFVQQANTENWKTISISVGVNKESEDVLRECANDKLRIDYITIDVAHGHHVLVKRMLSVIRKYYPYVFIIAGNTATPEATLDIEMWGADATKCCIGSGMACSTKLKTGFHVPSFTCVLNCVSVAKKPVIADGGITTYGDIAKALVAGATMVMCGGMFASCSDSPAPFDVGVGKKVYYGNASSRAKGNNVHVEGFDVALVSDITLAQKLAEMQEALQSSISYAGGYNLKSFLKTDYVIL
jgi:GMP reductase